MANFSCVCIAMCHKQTSPNAAIQLLTSQKHSPIPQQHNQSTKCRLRLTVPDAVCKCWIWNCFLQKI